MRPSDQCETPIFAETSLSGEWSRLVRLCTQLAGSSEAAEDLAQETLYEAWRHRDKLHDPQGQARWHNAIARNVCLRWRAAWSMFPSSTPPLNLARPMGSVKRS